VCYEIPKKVVTIVDEWDGRYGMGGVPRSAHNFIAISCVSLSLSLSLHSLRSAKAGTRGEQITALWNGLVQDSLLENSTNSPTMIKKNNYIDENILNSFENST